MLQIGKADEQDLRLVSGKHKDSQDVGNSVLTPRFVLSLGILAAVPSFRWVAGSKLMAGVMTTSTTGITSATSNAVLITPTSIISVIRPHAQPSMCTWWVCSLSGFVPSSLSKPCQSYAVAILVPVVVA